MIKLTAEEARAKFQNLIDETATTRQPILITGRRNNAVLLSEEDWNAVNETLHLLTIPGMRESIREGIERPIDRCEKELGW